MQEIKLKECLFSQEMKLKEYLFSLKIYPNNKGYSCVKECLSQLQSSVDVRLRGEMKISGIYKAASRKLGISPKAVEQNIIYAIENAWLKADTEYLRQEFGNTVSEEKCKPTCKQFLVTLLEKTKA
jgi:two-component system response regulator (stage 0 sporulation protein A)